MAISKYKPNEKGSFGANVAVEPGFEVLSPPWTLDLMKRVGPDLNQGDFESLGQLVHWICTHPRVASCNESREAALVSDAELQVTGGTAAERDMLREDIDDCLPPPVLNEILTWLRLARASLVQVIREPDGAPLLEPWNLTHLKLRGRQWYVREDITEEPLTKFGVVDAYGAQFTSELLDYRPIELGTDWLMLGTEYIRKPWHSLGAGWNIAGPLCIAGKAALVYWLRNALHTSVSPVMVKTNGQYSEDIEKFWEQIKQLSQTVWMEMPYGMTLERLQSAPLDFQSGAELKREIDMSLAEYLTGHSLVARMDKGGSYAAVEAIIDKISAPRLKRELALLATALTRKWLPLWKAWRGISSKMKFTWLVQSLDEQRTEAEIANMDADTANMRRPKEVQQ